MKRSWNRYHLKFILLFVALETVAACRKAPWDLRNEGHDAELQGRKGLSCPSFKLPKINKAPKLEVFSPETTLFGTEIEFPWSPQSGGHSLISLYRESLRLRCEQCFGIQACDVRINYAKVTIDNQNLTIYFDLDPKVIEVTTQPMNLDTFESWSAVIDSLIFGAARELGSTLANSEDHRNRWSGHVNVSWPGLTQTGAHWAGKKSQDDEAASMALLINYVIDAHNHPELAMGVLGGDIRNAPPLALGNDKDRGELEKVVQKYREKKFTSTAALAKALMEAVPWSFGGRFGPARYNLINLEHLTDSLSPWWNGAPGSRLELRGFFTPLSASEMQTNYRIVNARLKFLYENYVKRNQLVPFNKSRHLVSEFQKSGMQPPVTVEMGAEVYRNYLTQAGLSPTNEGRYLRDPQVRSLVLGETAQSLRQKPCAPVPETVNQARQQ